MNKTMEGLINGMLGVLIFSGSLPATRVAISGFDPLFLTAARSLIAGLLALLLVFLLRGERPRKDEILSLCVIALGVVVGFPLLTALALKHINAAHSIVYVGLLPLATAVFGVIRGSERPKPAFWLFSILGSAAVAGYALSGSGDQVSLIGGGLMVAAILACGLGYAEGARLSRRLGGFQVIAWALILSLPPMTLLAFVSMPETVETVGQSAWIGLAYVSLFSMLIGFIFWYRGLALGGIAAVSQLQLLQPFFGLMLAATLLGEAVSWSMALVTVLVVGCVAGARRFAR
jgi:Uncharacterized conserved protein